MFQSRTKQKLIDQFAFIPIYIVKIYQIDNNKRQNKNRYCMENNQPIHP